MNNKIDVVADSLRRVADGVDALEKRMDSPQKYTEIWVTDTGANRVAIMGKKSDGSTKSIESLQGHPGEDIHAFALKKAKRLAAEYGAKVRE